MYILEKKKNNKISVKETNVCVCVCVGIVLGMEGMLIWRWIILWETGSSNVYRLDKWVLKHDVESTSVSNV